MDENIKEALVRAFLESVEPSDFPMEPSDFLKDHLSLYSGIDYKIDLKLSNFKRVIYSLIDSLDW